MAEQKKHRILLVDDEIAITKALHRLLRKDGYQIDIANSGPEGIETIKEANPPFSLIISDQRMPGMSGSEFLEKTRELTPDTIRFLLTGYADLQTVVDAVNKGKIHRYLTKPWNDDALLIDIRQAMQDVEMRRENERLNLLAIKQNKQLYELAVSLEKKVKERTRELRKKNTELEFLNRKLEESFSGTIRLILSLVETTDRTMGKYLRQVGRLSKRVAVKMALTEKEVDTIETAGQLHDIGLLGLSDLFLSKPEAELTPDEMQRYSQHPVFAAIMLEAIEKLSGVSEIVLHHHENYDGSGLPNGFKGEEIPVGSRILAAVSDYCRFFCFWPRNRQIIRTKLYDYYGITIDSTGAEDIEHMLQASAEKVLLNGIHKKYDPGIISVMIAIFRKDAAMASKVPSGLVSLEDLQPGMIIPKDLFMKDGRLLLSQATVLDERIISALQKIGNMKMIEERISVEHRIE